MARQKKISSPFDVPPSPRVDDGNVDDEERIPATQFAEPPNPPTDDDSSDNDVDMPESSSEASSPLVARALFVSPPHGAVAAAAAPAEGSDASHQSPIKGIDSTVSSDYSEADRDAFQETATVNDAQPLFDCFWSYKPEKDFSQLCLVTYRMDAQRQLPTDAIPMVRGNITRFNFVEWGKKRSMALVTVGNNQVFALAHGDVLINDCYPRINTDTEHTVNTIKGMFGCRAFFLKGCERRCRAEWIHSPLGSCLPNLNGFIQSRFVFFRFFCSASLATGYLPST
jgi:hypothetical protein